MVGHNTVKGLMGRNFGSAFTGGNGNSGFLSKIQQNLPTDVRIRMAIIVIIIVLMCVFLYYFYKYLVNKFRIGYKGYNENIDQSKGGGGSGNEYEILLFTANWCPICRTARPIWDEIKLEYKGKIVNGYNIIFTEIDCTNETPETIKMMDLYKIEGFPTIKLLKNGQVIEFDAKVTKANLEKFINTVV